MAKRNRERSERELARHLERQMVINDLRDYYRLRVSDCIGDLPRRVQERQAKFETHLARLRVKWAEEDEEGTSGSN